MNSNTSAVCLVGKSWDFHVDVADLTILTCYNKAKSGGQSMISSGVTAHNYLLKEYPDLAEIAYQFFHFSRQEEQAPDEKPFYSLPLFEETNGNLFCNWNRNRVQSAQNIEGVPELSKLQNETMNFLDEILKTVYREGAVSKIQKEILGRPYT